MDAARVSRLARLLRIGLAPGEDAELAADLNAVLPRLAALDRLEPDPPGPDHARGGDSSRSTPPCAEERAPAIGLSALREDVPGPDPLNRSPEELAPAWRDGFFVMPRVR